MAETLLTLGAYQFSMENAAHDNLKRSKTYRWVQQQRLTREPASQFVGEGAETISLSGKIYPHFRGGLGQIDEMRAEADKGEALTLVDGQGTNLGQWVIKSISDTQKSYTGPGIPRCIDFSVSLMSYGADTSTGNSGGGGSGTGGIGDFFNFLVNIA
jgi:phage protein U